LLDARELRELNNDNLSETQKFNSLDKPARNEAGDILLKVYYALKEKGYNPVNQIVGYILSGDPTYITSHKNARSLINKMERDELLEEILCFYLQENLQE
jgi:uncharacterized protein (UPF0297 family)